MGLIAYRSGIKMSCVSLGGLPYSTTSFLPPTLTSDHSFKNGNFFSILSVDPVFMSDFFIFLLLNTAFYDNFSR